MRKQVKKVALFLVPLTFLLLGSSCDRHLLDYSDCWIDAQYQIDCWPDDPDHPFVK